MGKKQMLWKTKGMNQDLSVSAFNPEFAFENRNLRLSTNEHNTLLSWVNEKGTEEMVIEDFEAESQSPLSIVGTPIGTAVINHQLVLFTTQSTEQNSVAQDKIYVIEKNDDEETLETYQLKGKCLFTGNLNFDTEHLLETLVSYEAEHIQKVYWVDGKNQPRVINIVGSIQSGDDTQFDFVPTLTLEETVTVEKKYGAGGMFAPGVIQYAFTYFNKYGQESNIFYTTPLYYISFTDRAAGPDEKVDNSFKITVFNFDTKFDYLRIYSIQRTSLNGTPIVKRVQDIQLDKVSEEGITFKDYQSSSSKYVIKIDGVEKDIDLLAQEELIQTNPTVDSEVTIPSCDWWGGIKKADYPNLEVITSEGYVTWGSDSTNDSIMWFSSETSATYYICETTNASHNEAQELSYKEIPFDNSFSYIDTGLNGDSVDPMELLYKGGSDIIASTLEQKDNTLFFGNLQTKEENIGEIQVSGSPLKDKIKESTISTSRRDINTLQISSGSYAYWNQLNDKNCAGFKFGNYYRLGVQFQYKTGKWSEPLFIDDVQQDLTSLQVVDTQQHLTSTFQLPIFTATIDDSVCESLTNAGYRKARAVVVYPNQNDRVVVCQGVAAPTVYTTEHRTTNSDLYAQSSWIFRTLLNFNNIGTISSTCPPYYENDGTNYLKYTNRNYDINLPDVGVPYNPKDIRSVEIQGQYNDDNKFKIDWKFLTLHSPEIEFDTAMYSTDFSGLNCYKVGNITFDKTLSDIDIQTESAAVSNLGSGFNHKAFDDDNTFGIVSGLFYDDFIVDDASGNFQQYSTQKRSVKWLVYLWNKTGSLNNDVNRPAGKGTPSAILKKKVISNLRYATTTLNNPSPPIGPKVLNGFPQLFSSDEVSIVKVDGKIYQGNIDTVLTPDNADGLYFAFGDGSAAKIGGIITDTSFTDPIRWKFFDISGDTPGPGPWKYDIPEAPLYAKWVACDDQTVGDDYPDLTLKKELVRMKYKSTPHLAFKLDDSDSLVTTGEYYKLPIVEMRRDINPLTLFGGQTEDALRANVWVPCGEPVTLNENDDTIIEYSYGDTYYQRWDCLKTYAFTPEDENQVVEIGSFMLETYTNVEGRYDRNRGQKSNLNMSPRNFNLLNPVYSQKDNFFTYKITSNEDDHQIYPNQITWSLTKTTGADVDAWTNMSLGSILELDGNKGSVNKLVRLNDQLLSFQDSGISQILYNENVQIESTQGVPIEIANSGKVQGARYLSDTIGCSNKWSLVSTPTGIYFMDSNDKSIYLFNGQLQNLTVAKGFNTWAKKNILSYSKGEPLNAKNFKSFYDKLNQDVLFVNHKEALAWNEKLAAFTSFYDYGNTPYFVNLDDEGLWINTSKAEPNSIEYKIWKHRGSNGYCNFFGDNKPYSMVLVGNPEPQVDKIFTNLEFRACIDGDTTDGNIMPFDSLETWNEYQHGLTTLEKMRGHAAMQHGGDRSSLKRKFRIWRCDIPRDNYFISKPNRADYDTDAEYYAALDTYQKYQKDVAAKGISKAGNHPIDRMRNPWLYLELVKEKAENGETLPRIEIHDMLMTYFAN